MAKDNYNVQIPVRGQEVPQMFQGAYEASNAVSKGAFLKMLLDNWLDPESVVEKPIPFDNPELIEKIKSLENQLNSYQEHPMMNHLFQKNRGKTFKFVDNQSKPREIKVESKLDIFEICISLAISE